MRETLTRVGGVGSGATSKMALDPLLVVTTGESIVGPSGTGWISAIVSTSPGSKSVPADSVSGTTDDTEGSTGSIVSIGNISSGPTASGTREGRTTVGVLPTRMPGPSPSGV